MPAGAAPPEAVAGRFDVSRESYERLKVYVDLLRMWQGRINLIGPATVSDIWERHVADSLQLLPLLAPETKVLVDLGSGAGLPGLVVAIAGSLDVHLFESNLKKGAFLREAIRQTGASATIHTMRIEAAGNLAAAIHADAVTARALAPLPRLLSLAEPFLGNGAIGYFHKGQDVDAELTAARKSWRIRADRHPSLTDSRGSILVVKEAIRVA
ncbi:16S rRNA (guanine(527)-N(7))-methyltransferase RsmG [soil metagenome]